MKVNSRKVAVIGCGFVGSSSAFALMQSGLFSEMVLIDADTKRAEGEAMDISHGISFARPMQIYAGNYDDITDAAIIVITAGANQKPDETRLDLIKKNAAIMKSIVGEIKKRDFGGILLIVSNPVDILTLIALKESGYPSNRVIGSGTVLDTGRFKYLLGEHLDVDSRSVHAFIIGEHGDSELAAWSNARIGGLKVNDFCELRGHFNHEQSMKKIFENVRNSAYEIIERKHATYYGIAMAVKRICEAIVRNEKSILPVSSLMTGEYGLNDVVLSIPAVVDETGVQKVIPIELNDEELTKLKDSANILKDIAKEVKIPVLRKDFTVDRYMVYEAKIMGASAILLICAILTEAEIKEYSELAGELGLSVLIEAHTEKEVETSLRYGKIIGVNNRNLKTFEVDINTSLRLRNMVPKDYLYVSESGIRNAEDIKRLYENGTDAVLIGETLMRSADKKNTIAALRGI